MFQVTNPSTIPSDDEVDPFENLDDPFEDTTDPFGDGTIVRPTKAKLDRAKSLEFLGKVVETSSLSIEERLKSELKELETGEQAINIQKDKAKDQEEKDQDHEEKQEKEIEDGKIGMGVDNQVKDIGPKRNYLTALQKTPPSPCKKLKLSTYKTMIWPGDAKLIQRGERIYYSRIIFGGEEYRINDTIQFINFNLSFGSGYIGIIKSLYCNESATPYEYKNYVSCQFYLYPSEIAPQNREILQQDDNNNSELILSDIIDAFSVDLISKKVNVHFFRN